MPPPPPLSSEESSPPRPPRWYADIKCLSRFRTILCSSQPPALIWRNPYTFAMFNVEYEESHASATFPLWKQLRYLRITSVTGDQSRLISLWFWSVINQESIIWSLLRCWNASSSRSDRLVIWSNNSSSSRSDQFRVQFLGRILDRQGICVAVDKLALIHAPLIPPPDTWGRPDADYHYPPPPCLPKTMMIIVQGAILIVRLTMVLVT